MLRYGGRAYEGHGVFAGQVYGRFRQAHRADIERALGRELVWNRNDKSKNSKIYIEQKGVSIINEDDWPRIADYLAEWSKKLHDAFMPLIRELDSARMSKPEVAAEANINE